jgi:hypothetical protein
VTLLEESGEPSRPGTAPRPRFTLRSAVFRGDLSPFGLADSARTPAARADVFAKGGKLSVQFTDLACENATDIIAQL